MKMNNSENIQISKDEDTYLVASFQGGEIKAFDRLMAKHTDKVFALAWGVLHNREDALDAVQEVFVKLHTHLPKFKSDDNINAWVYRVCLNHCIDRKRRVKKPIYDLTEDDWERLRGGEGDEPEYAACKNETGKQIREAVDNLPKRQRFAFILRHYQLLSINEISEVIGCSPGAVKAHLSRATAKLRDQLKGTLTADTREVDRQ